MIDYNEIKRFECHSCGHSMERTIKQVFDKELGVCEKCGTKVDLADIDGIRNMATKDIERFKKDL